MIPTIKTVIPNENNTASSPAVSTKTYMPTDTEMIANIIPNTFFIIQNS